MAKVRDSAIKIAADTLSLCRCFCGSLLSVRSHSRQRSRSTVPHLPDAGFAAALAAPEVLKKPATDKPSATTTTTGSASRKPLSSGGASRRLLSSLTSISPTYGPMEGNSLVMVVGSGFNAETGTKQCQFGTSLTTATVINDTHISCRTPKHSTGSAAFILKLAADHNTGSPTFTFFRTYTHVFDHVLKSIYLPIRAWMWI